MTTAQIPLDLPHRASLARDDLIVTPANALAVAAIDSWPDWRHPVLVVVGPPGSGKSHLCAVFTEMAGAVPLIPGADLPSSGFALVIDDIDRATIGENELFQVVNAARLGGGHVLATARTVPDAMPFALADLRSRLKAATTVELGRPDDALLTGVLAKLFADRQIAVEPKLLDFIVRHMERSLESARRLVGEIDREALAGKERVARPLVQRVMAHLAIVDRSDSLRSANEESPAAACGSDDHGGTGIG